jgi:hypothetical protein
LPDGSRDDPGGGAQKESAAPAGPRNGAKKETKPATASESGYAPPSKALQRLLDRLERLSCRVDLGGLEMVPQPILDAIQIADEIAHDPDLEDDLDAEPQGDDEPWLGWCVNGERGDWQDLEIDRQPPADHDAVVLDDTAENDDDGGDPPSAVISWGFMPDGRPVRIWQMPPRRPEAGRHREGYSHRLGGPVQVGVGIHKIGTRPDVAKPSLATPPRDGKGGTHG